MIMRGLAQKKGADLMTAPSVTARSGQKATIEIIREFIYPTEYEPPELPNQRRRRQRRRRRSAASAAAAAVFPVTPATPTAFETRNTGCDARDRADHRRQRLRDRPALRAGDRRVRRLHQLRQPDPVAGHRRASATRSPSTITENRIEMPVFSTRRVNTALTIYDGYTVAVGGLMSRGRPERRGQGADPR